MLKKQHKIWDKPPQDISSCSTFSSNVKYINEKVEIAHLCCLGASDGWPNSSKASEQCSNCFSYMDTISWLKDNCEIHPLLRRPETFGLTHHLFIINLGWRSPAKRARKQRTFPSGIAEEHVRRPRDKKVCAVRGGQSGRTDVLTILEGYINDRAKPTGIDVSVANFIPLPNPHKYPV